ncbi:hypothetical protein ACFDTO_15275 [Microbacteriaceae bacterium 4G12]
MKVREIKLQYVIPTLVLIDVIIGMVSPENLVGAIIGDIAMVGAILGYNAKNK